MSHQDIATYLALAVSIVGTVIAWISMRPEAERASAADRLKTHIIGLVMAALPLTSMAFAFNDKFTAAVACMFISCILYTIYYLKRSGQPERIETVMLVVQFFGLALAACFSFLIRLASASA